MISQAIASALGALTLAGYNQSPADNLADRVEDAPEERADAKENRANALDYHAEQVRQSGEQRADPITAADRSVAATMSEERRHAVIANDAPAVR